MLSWSQEEEEEQEEEEQKEEEEKDEEEKDEVACLLACSGSSSGR